MTPFRSLQHVIRRADARDRRRERSILPDRRAWSGLLSYRDWDGNLVIDGHVARLRMVA